MKKIGIFADNYKLPMFKRELDAGGFKYNVTNGVAESSIQVHVAADQFEQATKDIGRICAKVELHFKIGN